jgi:DNA-directed RNA polymerase subunit omega
MARVTVEDCLHDVDSLFQLVLVAARRTRQIYAGSDPKVPVDGDKPTVIALREIAAGEVGREVLDEKLTPGLEFAELEPELEGDSEAAAAKPPAEPEI